MNDEVYIDVFCSDEICGSEKFKIILNIKNTSSKRIIIKNIQEKLVPGTVNYYDDSSTHLDLDNFDRYRKSIYDEMWMQVIDASKVILRKKNPVKYLIYNILKCINIGIINRRIDLISFKEINPHDFYIYSFYLNNNQQIESLKKEYIDNLDDNSQIKKAFYRNEQEIKILNENIEKLETESGRKYGKIIESNQYLKIPIEFSCNFYWQYKKESFIINITFEDEEKQIHTVSKEINLNIKPSKVTVFWGAFLGVSISMILINIEFPVNKDSNFFYSIFYSMNFLINITLSFLLSFLTYDDSKTIPIRSEGISGGFILGVLSVFGKGKLLEILQNLI